MADENTIETTATTETPAAVPAEKKTRKPRTPKAVAEASTVDATAAPVEKPGKKTRAKRGSTTAPVKAEKAAAAPKTAATRKPRVGAAASAPVATPVGGIDDIADLISLIHTIDWPVADKAMWLQVRDHFKTVIRLNHETWALIGKETDDDHEWLPGPHQKSGVLPSFDVSDARIQSWLALLDQVDLALDGKILVPHWRFTNGVNLAKVFEQPENFDLVLWFTGPAALPYLDQGPVMGAEDWSQATRIFGGDFAGYAFYFN